MDADYPKTFGFLLINDFTLISLSSAIEPLRMANRLSGKSIYSWRTIAESTGRVVASDGLSVNTDFNVTDVGATAGLDALIVCGGRRIERNTNEALLRWLRIVDKRGIALGAICTGSYVLAKAGLLDGYRCSVHWENLSTLSNNFSGVSVTRRVYTLDRNRFTSSGGTAPVDMMLQFVGKTCGQEICVGVAEQFVHERIRRADDRQRIPLRHTVGNQSEKLVVAVELMEANVREPISQTELAEYVGLS